MSFSFYFLGVSSIHYPLPEIPQIERINNRPATSRSEGNWKKSGEYVHRTEEMGHVERKEGVGCVRI
ncbi:hypothetical protein K443DRAFT_682350 [Laccaria amethystina LaAM-08-1]|uniref:Uncharacterized protein n=1 Tax=Laccaria amethystina LaAM-08-1 TaxID=1095629 RepID=A0A0C9X562_9AGAR|nr:hypothetical protein K443DRAFT_682350 [Laccaria amethystina LaAM-08-1]